jgi:hypothetical protein
MLRIDPFPEVGIVEEPSPRILTDRPSFSIFLLCGLAVECRKPLRDHQPETDFPT